MAIWRSGSAQFRTCSIWGEEGQADPRRMAPELPCRLNRGGAAKALEGVMLPMGGPKGSGLAIMMDVFSGVLSGSAFAGHVTGPFDPSKQADVGHFLVAIKPDLFMGLEEFKSRMDYLYQRVTGCEKAAGVERIYFPGELELIMKNKRLAEGIPFTQGEIDGLNQEAELVGAAKLKY